MKTFQKFNEDVNEFMKNTFMKNPTVKGIIDPLKDGNINMSDIKKKVTSKKGQEDLNDLKTKGLNALINFGKKKLTDFEKKVNK